MKGMIRVKNIIFLIFAILLVGCASEKSTPPPNTALALTVADLYKHAGVGIPIVTQRVLGKHYVPSLDQWSVVACVDFNDSGNETSDCNDSFILIKLDSGIWVLRGTVNGKYRWMEVSIVE